MASISLSWFRFLRRFLVLLTACVLSNGALAKESSENSTSAVWTQFNWRNEFNFSLPIQSRPEDPNSSEEVNEADGANDGITENQEEEEVADAGSTAFWQIINTTTTPGNALEKASDALQKVVEMEHQERIDDSTNSTLAPADQIGDEHEQEVLEGGVVEEDSQEEQNENFSTEAPNIRHHPKVLSSKTAAGNQKDCEPKLDLVFLLDTSGSIHQIYQEHVKWAVALVDSLPIERDTVRVAAVQYAGFPLTEFALGTYPNSRDIREHLTKINFQSGITRTGYALRKAEAELFRDDRGAREGAKKAIILFTDGLSIDDPLKPAQQLRDLKDVSIYVVNLGSDGFEHEMNRIAGTRAHVFGPKELERLREAILTEAENSRGCLRVGPPKPFTPRRARPAFESAPSSSARATSVDLHLEEEVVDMPNIDFNIPLPPSNSTYGNGNSTASPLPNTQVGAEEDGEGEEFVDDTELEANNTISSSGQSNPQPSPNALAPLTVADEETFALIESSELFDDNFEGALKEFTMPSSTVASKSIIPSPSTSSKITQPNPPFTIPTTPKTSAPPPSTASTLNQTFNVVPTTAEGKLNVHLSRQAQSQPVASRTPKLGVGTIREFPITGPKGNKNNGRSALFFSSPDHVDDSASSKTKPPVPIFPTLISIQRTPPTPPTPSARTSVGSTQHLTTTKRRPSARASTVPPAIQLANHRLFAVPNLQIDSKDERDACPIDWLFIIDSSGSVQRVYHDQKKYLNDILQQIHLGHKAHRVAVLQFAGSDVQKTEWTYDTFNNSEALMHAFGQVRLITGTTYIGKALESALHILNSRRREVPSIAVLLSDGFSQDDASQAAEKLRRMVNLEFYALSISDLSNTPYLTELVGSEAHVFTGDRKDELKRVLSKRLHCQRG